MRPNLSVGMVSGVVLAKAVQYTLHGLGGRVAFRMTGGQLHGSTRIAKCIPECRTDAWFRSRQTAFLSVHWSCMNVHSDAPAIQLPWIFTGYLHAAAWSTCASRVGKDSPWVKTAPVYSTGCLCE